VALPSGTRLGPYEILSPLGAGGMGEVYRARDKRLDRDVAIKVLPEPVATDSETLARFEREAKAVAALSHPNILSIHDFGNESGVAYAVMELLEGGTLRDKLDAGPIPHKHAVDFALQIAKGLSAAHEKGIVHRDLKPENLFVMKGCHVKILDFGLAKRVDLVAPGAETSAPTASGRTRPGTVMGTLGYMSPEQVRGLPVDLRSDIFSFGAILYELLSGKRAFHRATAADTMAAIMMQEPRELAGSAGSIPPALWQIVRHCLEKRPDQRFQSAHDLAFALKSLSPSGASETPAPKSIAVLPFASMSADPENDYFSDGISEEIINALAQLEGLHVAARTSAFSFKGKTEDLRTVGEKLNVTTVLEGSVRKAGNRLRITAQLINVADGYHLWSQRYDRELTDVFSIQDEIASAIAAKLRVTLAGGRQKPLVRGATSNLEAYEHYLRGRALLSRRGRAIPAALESFEEAAALDPRYAPALAGISDSNRQLAIYGLRAPAEVMPRARDAAERALELDPDLAGPCHTLAHIHLAYDRDAESAVRFWKRALELDPKDPQIHCEYGLWAMLGRGDTAGAFAEIRQGIELDPFNSWVAGIAALVFGMAGRFGEGLAEARRAIELDAEAFLPRWILLQLHSWASDYPSALAAAEPALRMSARHTWVLGALGTAHGRAGRREEAEAIRAELAARSRTAYVQPFWPATVAAAMGETEEAFALLQRAVDERDPLVMYLRVWPDWEPLRADSRFIGLVQRLGLA